MTLGESIYQLRTARNMSQGDLADALDVSRQSVSKWENNMAVPELDKLMKMSELFGVSLDTLVRGEIPAPSPEDIPQTPNDNKASVENPFPPRKIAGTVLFCMAFLTVLVCTALGGMLEGLVFALPFLMCGAICFLFRRRVGLWCAWAVFALVDVYLTLFTGVSRGLLSIYNFRNLRHLLLLHGVSPVSLIVSVVLTLALLLLLILTVVSFRKMRLAVERRRVILLCAGWLFWILVPLLLRFAAPEPSDAFAHFQLFSILNVFVDWLRIGLLATLFVRTIAMLRTLRKPK